METKSLKLIKGSLKSIIENLEWKSETGPSGTIKLSGLAKLRYALNELSSLNLFDDIVNTISNSILFTTSKDQINIQPQEAVKVDSDLKILKTLISNFQILLLATVPEEDLNSINVKLPPLENFDELSRISRDIHVALSQVIFNPEINGETKIRSVENGSIWFNVFVGAAAVSVIGSLVWAAAVIYKKILEGKLLAEQVRGLKVKNDSIEDILRAQKTETDLLIQVEAEHIASEYFHENVPENIERIKNSISILAGLIEKGAEIKPALMAPENISNLFPDPRNIIGLESKIKKLTS